LEDAVDLALDLRAKCVRHDDAAMDRKEMARESWGDRLEPRPAVLEEPKAIELNDGPAITHRSAVATAGAHADPVEAPIETKTAWFCAQASDADDGVKLTSANRAHAVGQTENAFGVGSPVCVRL
jgi:hypothetical protein